MPTGPKQMEDKLREMVNAWEQMAPNDTFSVTLADFKTGIKPSFDVRDLIADLDDQKAKALNDRAEFDEASMTLAQRVINAALAHPGHGPNSSIVEGFGRTRESERQSGMTRKKKAAAAPKT
jgi:hypothetical protein